MLLKCLFASVIALSPVVASAYCFEEAARYHGVEASWLRAIAKVESGGNAGAIGKNDDGSEDLGLMQINSSWLPKLARFGVTREVLLRDPCVNAHVGAWVLADSIRRYGPTWRAVGAYNAKSESKRLHYASLVENQLTGVSK